MVVGYNRHILKYLKYDSSFSLLLIDQSGFFNISLNVDRISLFLECLLFGSFGSLSDFFQKLAKLVKGVLKICSNFIEITLRHECSPVILLYIFRIPFSKKTSGWLLLNQVTCLANVGSKIDFVEDFRNCKSSSPFPLTQEQTHLDEKKTMFHPEKYVN